MPSKRATDLTPPAPSIEAVCETSHSDSRKADALAFNGASLRCGPSWNTENRQAVTAYNERIATEGLPLEKYRSFMRTL